jgi:hypothetical protein
MTLSLLLMTDTIFPMTSATYHPSQQQKPPIHLIFRKYGRDEEDGYTSQTNTREIRRMRLPVGDIECDKS